MMTRVMSPEASGDFHGDNPSSKTTSNIAGGLLLEFSWTFDWAEKLNAETARMGGSDLLKYLKQFIQTWESFCDSPSGRYVFPESSDEHKKGFLLKLGSNGSLAHNDLSTQAFLGMRLMYTWARACKPGKKDQFRCWFGVPSEFSGGYTESDQRGLLFTVRGSSTSVVWFIDGLLSAEDKESGFDICAGSTSTTIFGLLVHRKRLKR